MKITNRQLLSRASRKATSVPDFIKRMPADFIASEYYFVIARVGAGISNKAVLKHTGAKVNIFSKPDRSDDPMTVVAYNYPVLVLRYTNIVQL